MIKTMMKWLTIASLATGTALATPSDNYQLKQDWLVQNKNFKAAVRWDKAQKMLILENGLIRRKILLGANAATVGFDNLMTGEGVLRGIKPEALVTLNGIDYEVGGLKGQRNYAFLPSDLSQLKNSPSALQFEKYEISEIESRLEWKKVRHVAPNVEWPPKGKHLRLDFRLPLPDLKELAKKSLDSTMGRTVLLKDNFTEFKGWSEHRSSSHARSSFVNEGKVGEIYTPANTCCYAERKLPTGTRLIETSFSCGTDKSKSYGPGISLLFGDKVLKFNIRPGAACFGSYDGKGENSHFGGRQKLKLSGKWHLRMLIEKNEVICEARQQGQAWKRIGVLSRPAGEATAVRLGKTDVNGGKNDHVDKGDLVRLKFDSFLACSNIQQDQLQEAAKVAAELQKVRVSVHYNIYDGVPLLSKWISVDNGTGKTLRLNSFTSEILAVVEAESYVEHRPSNRMRDGVQRHMPKLHVETDYAMGAMKSKTANAYAVHWDNDPQYSSQVNYRRETKCLLKVGLRIGPDQDIAPSKNFESFRAFIMPQDSFNRERQGLAQKRMYRTIAPWVLENPLMMHARFAQEDKVKQAIDQAAECGFEMVILTFGSGFQMENDSPAYLDKMKKMADYAKSKNLEIGGYSLLSSRRIGGGNDNVAPADLPEAHGNSPSLNSAWGAKYMKKLYNFYPKTGFSLLEQDGPYPGDFDTKERLPLQKGLADSQYSQWKIASDYYAWLRSQGVYLNQPDWYFLRGANKTVMGYREVNWSLPRAEQRIHTRQNIFDGTWEKTPSMGWM
ncbi:MAG: hypothetical protein HRT88_14305, partial [Lentisphaeraceae bacterium]|nr:hypothetical protein [Lentisphaeraceae bacterium]